MILLSLFINCVLFFVGFSLLSAVLPKKSVNTQFIIGGGYALSLTLIVTQLFLFSLVHIPVTGLSVTLPWVVLAAVSLLLFQKGNISVPYLHLPKNKIDLIGVCFILALILFVGIEAMTRPPIGWDAIATWLLMGKAFYYGGGFSTEIYHFAQFDGPPAVGLILTFFYSLFGKVDNSALIIFSSVYVAILFMLYGSIKTFVSSRISLLFTFFFAALSPAIHQSGRFDVGYADLPLSLFILSAASCLMVYGHTKQRIFLVLSSIFAGFLAFIKNEGSAFLLVYLVVSEITILKVSRKDVWCLAPGIIYFTVWHVFKYYNPLNPSYYEQSMFVFGRIGLVINQMLLEFFRVDRWNLLWVSMLFAVVFYLKKTIRFIPFQLFLLQLLFYFFIYMITPLDPVDHMVGSFDRLLLQIAPLAILSVAFCSYDILKKYPLFGLPSRK